MLEDDDPEALDLMLYFFYNQDYADGKESSRKIISQDSTDVTMTNAGDGDEGESNPCDDPLYLNALAYGIADKYGVLDMKTYAKERTMTRLLSMKFGWVDFLRGAKVVWMTTPGSDNGLRHEYMEVALRHRKKILENEELFRQLHEAGDFAMDLLMEDWKTNYLKDRALNMERRLTCNGCDAKPCDVRPFEPKCKKCYGNKTIYQEYWPGNRDKSVGITLRTLVLAFLY